LSLDPSSPSARQDIRLALLKRLVAASGSYLSGALLAEELGVSRVSIKNHIDHWVSEGFIIDAVRNRGYALRGEPTSFHSLALQATLLNHAEIPTLLCPDEVDSTSTEVSRLLHGPDPDPVVVTAGCQLAGRGRRGNTWMSQPNGNLYLSIGFRPGTETARIGTYTLWVGICVAEFLRQKTGHAVMVKWPNDLYLSERKLGGILTEAKIDSEHVQHLVIGLGLNVNTAEGSFPAEIADRAISLRIANKGIPFPFASLASELTHRLILDSRRFFEGLEPGLLESLWPNYDFLAGRAVEARGPNGPVNGHAQGIDDKGHLLLLSEDGNTHRIHSGEVTLAFERKSCM
jgi:BirA family transcriptional regulator, biotin operon repressor / biotin---[acetyl-CoA-carboxylase] ligase